MPLQTHAPHSKEAQLAQDNKFTYSEALKSIYDRRTAFSNANPFSARVIGQGAAFTYRQGILCVLDGNIIRVSDAHTSSASHEIDLSPIINSIAGSSSSPSEPKVSLLYYSDNALAVHYERKGRPNDGRIFVINTKANIPEHEKRVLRELQLESSYKLFVRHTSSYLYYGTYTGMGSHGHHEWEIRGVSLRENRPLPPKLEALQLEEFFGTDVGSTIAFEIYGDYFYAVSNQTSFDVEELDWTSFYHCIRFPLEQPVKNKMEIDTRVYRRQHAEGPIHDSWTDLTLQADESTNEVMIVESRREWQNASSRQYRTFYISKFLPEKDEDSITPSDDGPPLLPANDAYTDLLESSNRPNYAPPRRRCTWEFHPEFPPNSDITSRSFILARTKFRAYNLPCSSFLDLVEDEKCCNDYTTGPCLRIRIGSRRVAPAEWVSPDSPPSNRSRATSPPIIENDAVYRHSKLRMWPPPPSKCACAKKLHRILNPEPGRGGSRTVTGVVDERSLVYMVKAARTYATAEENAKGVIVLVNFARDLPSTSAASAIPDIERTNPTNQDSGLQIAMDIEDVQNVWHWTTDCRKGRCL